MIEYMVICVALGVATETVAQVLKLWQYQAPWIRVLNVLVVFGVIFGLISYEFSGYGFRPQFFTGAGLGLVYEVANDRLFHAWRFPGNPRWLKGRLAVYGIGVAWGLIPPIAVALRGLLP